MKRILMVAYHFPPLAGSSGIQRTLRFAQHLPAFGWEPLVLSAHPRAYEKTSEDLLRDIPAGTVVQRAFALDSARHLSLRGRYFGWTARPDRWAAWRFAAVRDGMRMIARYRPDVIWSTFPIATAHLIGAILQQRSGLPWVADFRDPMAQDGYPSDPAIWRSYKDIEEQAAANARLCVYTTPGAVRQFNAVYPEAAPRTVVIENGYDEESFAAASPEPANAPVRDRPLILLHSGIVYQSERDPTQLFLALDRLRREGKLTPADLRIRFRAAVQVDFLRELSERCGVADFIELADAVPYREALAEMLTTDALLVLQASNCNDQIPAKIYEYLRAGRPVIGLTDPAGDTAGVLRGAGLGVMARLDSADEIAALLPAFVASVRAGNAGRAAPAAVAQASRLGRAETLAGLLDGIVAGTGNPPGTRSRT